MKNNLFFLVFIFTTSLLFGQETWEKYCFLSYDKIPTCTGVAVDWQSNPQVHLYDSEKYKGHSNFIKNGLGRNITFEQFRLAAKSSKNRQYLPFFLYDLRKFPISVGGKKYNWAIKLEDYSYDDTPKQMTETLLKLAAMIPNLSKEFGKSGIILLSKNPDNKVNMSLKPDLEAKGYACLTEKEMTVKQNGASFKVLSDGVAYGKLILVKNEEEMMKLTPQDIAIFDFVPVKVPIVAGFITLYPQTPLSHINLLAKNRGTVNIYISSLNELNKAGDLMGKYVKLSASPTGYSIEGTDYLSVKRFNENLKETSDKIFIPPAEVLENEKVIFPITKGKIYEVNFVGTKAANYSKMYELLGEKYVRPAYAIGFGLYQKVVVQKTQPLIDALLEKKDNLSIAERRNLLKEIRTSIKNSKIPQEDLTYIYQKVQTVYENSKIRLRSSTNCEDLDGFNGAGLYLSKGFNTQKSKETLEKKLLAVFASLWNDFAFEERDYFGIDHKAASMAVLVHEAFENETEYANGVVLAKPRESDGSFEIFVNMQADSVSITNPQKSDASELIVLRSNKPFTQYKVESYSSIRPIFAKSANDELLKELYDNTLKAYAAFTKDYPSRGIDMEVKIVKTVTGKKLYFKQIRLF